MKRCDYCGRENADEAAHCGECGTSEFAPPDNAGDAVRQNAAESDRPGDNRFPGHLHPGFCDRCLAETIEVECEGVVSMFHRNGPTFWDERDKCPFCASVVCDLKFKIYYVPIIHLDTYRIKHLPSGSFLSRKVGTTYSLSDTPIMLRTASVLETGDPEQAIRRYERIATLFPDSAAGREAARTIQLLRANRPQSVEEILQIEDAETAINKLVEWITSKSRHSGRDPSRSAQAIVDIKWLDAQVHSNGFHGWLSQTTSASMVRTLDSLTLLGCRDIMAIVVKALAEVRIDPRAASDFECEALLDNMSRDQRQRLTLRNNEFYEAARNSMDECKNFALAHRSEM